MKIRKQLGIGSLLLVLLSWGGQCACHAAASGPTLAEETNVAADKLVKKGVVYYRLNDADNTAAIVKAPPQYDYEKYANISGGMLDLSSKPVVDGVTYDVTAVADSAFYGWRKITKVKLPSTLKHIGKLAFCYTTIKEINLPDGLETIADMAFHLCDSLSGIVLPESLDSLGAEAFSYDKNITQINIPSGLTHIGKSPFRSTSVEEVPLPENMEEIPEALFDGCYSLKSIQLPKSVKRIGRKAFYQAGLKALDLHEGIEYIGELAFGACRMTELRIPSTVKFIGKQAFEFCTSLETVELSEGIEELSEKMFEGCNKLSHITLPNSLKSIHTGTFMRCESLLNFQIPASVTEIEGNPFARLTMESITIEEGNNHFIMKDGYLYTADGKKLIYAPTSTSGAFTVPEGVENIAPCAFMYSNVETCKLPNGLREIGHDAFKSCVSLSEINIPETVLSIGESAFSFCRLLESIELPKGFHELSASCFLSCKSLKEIKNTESIMVYGQGALQSTAISEFSIPEGVEVIPPYLFYACRNLKNISLPSSVKTLGEECFYACGFEEITLPQGLKEIGRGALSGTQIKSMTLPGGLTTIGEQAFCVCKSLQSINMKACQIADIPKEAFRECILLNDVQLPENLERIGVEAFKECSALAEIELPSALKHISNWAFSYCEALTQIELPEGLEDLGQYVIIGSGVKELTIPKSVKYLSIKCLSEAEELETLKILAPLDVLPYSCCAYNTKLKHVELNDAIKSFGPFALYDINDLETITLPSGLENVEYHGIANCPALTSIVCPAVVPPAAKYEPFDESLYTQATLKVPEQSVEEYKSAEYWRNFLTVENITAGLNPPTCSTPSTSSRIYDLRGMVKQAEQGIYIKDGKVRIKSRQ